MRSERNEEMEILLPKADLVRELYFLQGIVERKSAIPILSNTLIEARGQELSFSATDLDISLRSECPARVVAEGAITVSTKKLYEIARSLPDSDVTVKLLPDYWVAIESGSVVFKLAGLPKQDYPALPQRSGAAAIEIDGEALRDLTARTAFAISGEDARYYLAGALLVLEDGAAALVATDGHRLAYARRADAYNSRASKRVLVPRKAVHEIGRLLEAGDKLEFEESGNHLLFTVGKRTLASKMVEGQFPSFENVIATKGDKKVQISRELLLTATRRVSLVASDRTRSVRLTAAAGTVTVAAASAELGEARETVAAEYDGDEVTIGFNAQYLVDFLLTAGTETVSIDLKNAESQGVFRPVGEAPTDHCYIVMPMRL
jgi:DNA polymerase-3 subunit beta